METVDVIRSLHTIVLDKSPCCLEFCPGSLEYFVVGTYHLLAESDHDQENTEIRQPRDGSLILFKLADNTIALVETIETSFGILDVHFSPHAPRLGVATSTGCIALYHWYAEDGSLQHVDTFQVFANSVVVTSLAWNPRTEVIQVCITTSTGEVVLVNLRNFNHVSRLCDDPSRTVHVRPGDLIESQLIFKHELEAWTVVFIVPPSKHETGCITGGIFSGGDDAELQYTSERAWTPLLLTASAPINMGSFSTQNLSIAPEWRNRRIHGAGVTAILPLLPGYIATGSYDDHIRLIKLPDSQGKGLQTLAALSLNGGVWRLKLIALFLCSEDGDAAYFSARILVSCMYAGVCLVEIRRNDRQQDWNIRVLARFEEHESMCYACDMQPTSKDEGLGRIYVSCSFYDKRLCMWRC